MKMSESYRKGQVDPTGGTSLEPLRLDTIKEPTPSSPVRSLRSRPTRALGAATLLAGALAVSFISPPEPTSAQTSSETQPTRAVEDILVLYTEAARLAVPDIHRRVIEDIRDTNMALKYSGSSTQIDLVGLTQVDYKENDSSTALTEARDGMTNTRDDKIPEAQTLRNLHGADAVILYVNSLEAPSCGVTHPRTKSNDPYYAEFSYGVVNLDPDCQVQDERFIFAHELGHMHGMMDTKSVLDGREIAPDVMPFVYEAVGIEEIMSSTPTNRRVRYYSNLVGPVRGVLFGEAGRSNAVRVIDATAPSMAANRESKGSNVLTIDTPTLNIAPSQTSVTIEGGYSSRIAEPIADYALNPTGETTTFTPLTISGNRWRTTIPASQITGAFTFTGFVNGRPYEYTLNVTRNAGNPPPPDKPPITPTPTPRPELPYSVYLPAVIR